VESWSWASQSWLVCRYPRQGWLWLLGFGFGQGQATRAGGQSCAQHHEKAVEGAAGRWLGLYARLYSMGFRFLDPGLNLGY